MRSDVISSLMSITLAMLANSARADDTADVLRLANNQRFMTLVNQPTGLIVPLYQYPADIHRNKEFNRLMDLKKSHPTVPVCVIHENDTFPSEESLRGDYFGGYADYLPFTRAVLVHSLKTFDRENFARTRTYVRWIYVTHDRFDSKADPNDPKNNPWDELSHHIDTLFDELSRPNR